MPTCSWSSLETDWPPSGAACQSLSKQQALGASICAAGCSTAAEPGPAFDSSRTAMLPATCLLAAVQLAGLTASIAEENANTAGEACDVAGEAGGWLTTSKGARAVKGELNKVDQTGCDIERRSFESMDADTFENLYFNKKAVILYHYPERQPAAKGSDKNVLQKDWDAEKVQAWLTQMGLSKVAAEAVSLFSCSDGIRRNTKHRTRGVFFNPDRR